MMSEDKPRCGSCRFFNGSDYMSNIACKRHAPIGVPYKRIGMDDRLRADWPRVDWNNWCGDYESKPPSASDYF